MSLPLCNDSSALNYAVGELPMFQCLSFGAYTNLNLRLKSRRHEERAPRQRVRVPVYVRLTENCVDGWVVSSIVLER